MEAGKKRRQFRGLHVALAIAAILGILAFLLLPGLFRAREGARRARCMSNLKMVGLALKQYALDNDEAFPWDASEQERYYRFFGKLHPFYADDLELFHCPSSHDRLMLVENRGDPNSLFKESECKSGLSYAYGICGATAGEPAPWTESAPSSARIATDKYATHDYDAELHPRNRPFNHSRRGCNDRNGGRNFICLDGSARWDDDVRMLEADPETEFEESNDPKHDQTGTDWWSDPPDK
jgi:type II secretory pathway pseudopilin PulG